MGKTLTTNQTVALPAHLETKGPLSPETRTCKAADRLRGCEVFVKLATGSDQCDALCNEWLLLHRLARGYFVRPVEFRYLSSSTAYLTTEFVPGNSFQTTGLISDEERFFGVVQQALEGLAVLHRAGFVHGDVRPQNLMVGGRGKHTRVLWTDLEHATQINGTEASLTYVSGFHDPALDRGGAQSARTDLYAFGQTVLERIPSEEDLESGWGECLLTLAEALCEPSPVDCLHDADMAVRFLDSTAQAEGVQAMPPTPCFGPPISVVNVEAKASWQARWAEWSEARGGICVGVIGPAGCGKSTFLREMASELAVSGHSVLDLLPGAMNGGTAGIGVNELAAFISDSQKIPVILVAASDAAAFRTRHKSALRRPAILIVEASEDAGPFTCDEHWPFPVFSQRRWYQWVTASI